MGQNTRIFVTHIAESGLFSASSPDLPGLLVVGETLNEVVNRVPAAIEQLLTADSGFSATIGPLSFEY